MPPSARSTSPNSRPTTPRKKCNAAAPVERPEPDAPELSPRFPLRFLSRFTVFVGPVGVVGVVVVGATELPGDEVEGGDLNVPV